MRDAFVRTLTALAKANPAVELVAGDVGFGVLRPFYEQCPDQFTNAGIAEQNMTALAAGMALCGKTVFTYSIGNFPTLRCLEQIRNDCAYPGANVKIVCVGGGLAYGGLGMSHHATEDLAILRALPGVTVFAPGDAAEAAAVTRAAASLPGTCYIRLGRGGEIPIRPQLTDFAVGRALPVCEGARAALLSTGGIYGEVARACERLRAAGLNPTVYTFPTVKPMDAQTVRRLAAAHELLVTCEEHTTTGGLGGAVAEIMAEMPAHGRLLRIGLDDRCADMTGDTAFLRRALAIDGESIASRTLAALA